MDIRLARALSGFIVVAMAAAIVYGMVAGDFLDEVEVVIDIPWGQVSLIDLASGLVLIGAWIGWRETSPGRVVAWWLALLFLGNLAAGLYVAWAARHAATVPELLTGRPELSGQALEGRS